MSRRVDPYAVELTPDLILRAYRAGMFPMADSAEAEEVYWVAPAWRGVIPLEHAHISRSLKRTLRRNAYRLAVDTDFEAVVAGCAGAGADREETWINAAIRENYHALFVRGVVHTVEVWDGAELAGGLYGVAIGAAFFGESMFHRKTDCSKIALAHLIDRLTVGGYRLLDTQFLTEHLRRFGGLEIARDAYEGALAAALAEAGDWHAIDRDGKGGDAF